MQGSEHQEYRTVSENIYLYTAFRNLCRFVTFLNEQNMLSRIRVSVVFNNLNIYLKIFNFNVNNFDIYKGPPRVKYVMYYGLQ